MLKVNTRRFGSTAVLWARGRIIRGETDALQRAVLDQKDINVVVLDLAQVNTIDAGGLGVMLELREQTEARGIEFRLKNVSRLVKRILEITRLDSVFEISTGNEISMALANCRTPIFHKAATHC